MPSSKHTYDPAPAPPNQGVKEEHVEYGFIGKLQALKYEYRPDIRDRASLQRNFREKFEALNRVHLSDGEFARLLEEICTSDVYTAARTLRDRNAFIREGYIRFKKQKDSTEVAAIATKHSLSAAALQGLVDGVLQRLILDSDALSDLMAPLQLSWKARAQAEAALMADVAPLLRKRAQGREIAGLSAYE